MKYMCCGMMVESTPLFEIPPEGIEAYVAKCATDAAAFASKAINSGRPALERAEPEPRKVIEAEACERLVKLNELFAAAQTKNKDDRSAKESAAIVLMGSWETHKTAIDNKDRALCEKEFLDMLDGGNHKFDIVFFLLEFSPMPRQWYNIWRREYIKDLKKNREKEQDALRWTMAEDTGLAGNSSLPKLDE